MKLRLLNVMSKYNIVKIDIIKLKSSYTALEKDVIEYWNIKENKNGK